MLVRSQRAQSQRKGNQVHKILVIHASNFGIMDKVKDKLAVTKLYNFTGENVEV